MSDVMLFGVLRMPQEMALNGEIAQRQFYDRAQQACDRIEEQERALADAERRYQIEKDIADRACAENVEHDATIEQLQTRLAAAEELLNRMGGFLDGMYRRPPPIVERLLTDWAALNSAASDTPKCGEEESE